MKLLFCGGNSRTMISAVRSLGRKGHQIDVAVSGRRGLSTALRARVHSRHDS